MHIFNVVFSASSPQVPLTIEIALQVAIHCGGQRITPNVEFPVFVEQRLLTVLLDNVRSFFAVDVCITNDLLNLGEFTTNCDSTASISILTGFHNPEVLTHRWVLLQFSVLIRFIISLFELVEC